MEFTGKYHIICNKSAGTVLSEGEGKIKDGLTNILYEKISDIRFVQPQELEGAVRKWVHENPGGETGLLIGGGDGSFRTAAAVTMGTDVPVGQIALGTQNVNPDHFGFSRNWRDAAVQYSSAEIASVDVGRLNNRLFMIGFMLDMNSVNFFEARESRRGKNYLTTMAKGAALLGRFAAAAPARLDIHMPDLGYGVEQSGKIFVISNNAMRPEAIPPHMLSPAKLFDTENLKTVFSKLSKKDSLQGGKLAFYAWSGDLAIAASAANGSWTEHASVTKFEAREFWIDVPDNISRKPHAYRAVFDGEKEEITLPARAEVLPSALRVFTARNPRSRGPAASV